MKDWKIVSSKTGYDKNEIPAGEYLVRFPEDLQSIIDKMEKPIIKDYKPSYPL